MSEEDKKVDYLEVDEAIPGQNYVCLSFLSPESLMLYSSVCGCGIDMLPLPGDIFVETISCLICDVISLSQKLNKPLGVRILPIPGKFSNEKTSFNHDFLSDMKILNIRNSILPNLNFGFSLPLHGNMKDCKSKFDFVFSNQR